MIQDSVDSNTSFEPRRSTGIKLLAVLAALVVSGALLIGYALMRKRHAQETLTKMPAVEPSATPKGPPKAQITLDEPLLKGSDRIVGGRVKNLSPATLSGLKVHLELRQRKDGKLAESEVQLEPARLEANQEGSYSVKMPAQDYASVRLIGLSADPDSTQLAYTSLQGKQRPPERLEPKTIIIKRSSKGDSFLNSPDNPARVP